jgi:hypothetical protein
MGPANNVTDLLRPKKHWFHAAVLSDISEKQKAKLTVRWWRFLWDVSMSPPAYGTNNKKLLGYPSGERRQHFLQRRKNCPPREFFIQVMPTLIRLRSFLTTFVARSYISMRQVWFWCGTPIAVCFAGRTNIVRSNRLCAETLIIFGLLERWQTYEFNISN